jgi:ribosomal peptide maturation radical SAM protein 1
MEMHGDNKSVLLVSMPFAGITIPSIQLPILSEYLKERNINVKTKHLYLKAAEFYGLKNYDYLSNTSGISYAAQMAFSKYVFSQHWTEEINKFENYFNKIFLRETDKQKNFTFKSYIEQTDRFFNWIIEKIEWNDYDIVGFTLNYGQFLPSLAVSKKLKEHHPDIKIIFGGGRTVGELGIKVLEAFEFVDFIVSGDGEESLYLLASNNHSYDSIPNLIYRVGEKVVWNQSDFQVNLNNNLHLNFDSFYQELSISSNEVQKYFHLYGRLPVEISRGCWWNKCTFCNLNLQHSCYREKSVEKIIEEIKFLSDRYKILNFHLIGNTLPKGNYRYLLEEIKKIGKDFSFFVEARAGGLKSSDYTLLKEAGFIVMQTGIEAFSQNYLKKMNKGARVIDNIATLKFCKENEIKNDYNLIFDYPNEERIDFEESKKNIQFFMQYLDPPQLNNLLVGFGSHIYKNPKEYNIEKLDFTDIDKIMFPMDFLEKGFNFYYTFKRRKKIKQNNWEQLVEEWKNEYEKFLCSNLRNTNSLHRLIFYFVDGGNFLKIYDKRDSENVRIYVLNEVEREIFLSCIDITSISELEERFSNIPNYELTAILYTFEKNGIVFKEDNYYLSLPLQYNVKISENIKKELITAAV